jgi:hypothetical protein
MHYQAIVQALENILKSKKREGKIISSNPLIWNIELLLKYNHAIISRNVLTQNLNLDPPLINFSVRYTFKITQLDLNLN